METNQPYNELEDNIRRAYLADRRIASLYNQMAVLYILAIPTIIIRPNQPAEFIYDEDTKHEVNRLREIIVDITKSEYPFIISEQKIQEPVVKKCICGAKLSNQTGYHATCWKCERELTLGDL